MPELWAGITNTSNKVTIVYIQFDEAQEGCSVLDDFNFSLPEGNKADGYKRLYDMIKNSLCERGIQYVVVKASATTRTTTQLSHLHSAELRGVVMAASAASNAVTMDISIAQINRRKDHRNLDEYVIDQDFWNENIVGKVRIGSRDNIILVLSARQ